MWMELGVCAADACRQAMHPEGYPLFPAREAPKELPRPTTLYAFKAKRELPVSATREGFLTAGRGCGSDSGTKQGTGFSKATCLFFTLRRVVEVATVALLCFFLLFLQRVDMVGFHHTFPFFCFFFPEGRICEGFFRHFGLLNPSGSITEVLASRSFSPVGPTPQQVVKQVDLSYQGTPRF